MAAFGVALWKYSMRYAPHSPDWFNRDRFVLSNGIVTHKRYMDDLLIRPRPHMSLPVR